MAGASSFNLNDHVPAHVHGFGDGEAKINLLGSQNPPDLVWADNMTRSEVRRLMRVITEQQAFLLQRWEDIHGRAD